MTIGSKPRCMNCKHYDPAAMEFVCKAFPLGIPDTIVIGKVKHDKPLPGQGNNIVFEQFKP